MDCSQAQTECKKDISMKMVTFEWVQKNITQILQMFSFTLQTMLFKRIQMILENLRMEINFHLVISSVTLIFLMQINEFAFIEIFYLKCEH